LPPGGVCRGSPHLQQLDESAICPKRTAQHDAENKANIRKLPKMSPQNGFI